VYDLVLPAIVIGVGYIIAIVIALLKILVLENIQSFWRNKSSSKHNIGWLSEEVAAIMISAANKINFFIVTGFS